MSEIGIDIGHDVTIEIRTLEGVPAGLDYWHPCAEGRRALGFIPFADRPADMGYSWTVEQDEPLTISPSLLCRACGHHGFIRGGRWVPA